VPGQVICDDPVVAGNLLILEKVAPLVIMASRRVLAYQRLPRPFSR
jgi:hypothetical protein